MENKESLRLFYALWPDDATRAALREIQATMQGKISRYENLHMTLAFLGQQPATLLPALTDILAHLPALELTMTLDHVGSFTRNRIAWAGTREAPPALHALHRHLVQALGEHRVAFDGKSVFRPHITLARDTAAPPDRPFTPIRWRADHAVLVKSTLRADGPVYEVLASRNLSEPVWMPDEKRLGN